MRWLIGFLLALVAPLAAQAAPAVRVTLTRAGDEWLVDYAFARQSPVWVFQRTASDLDGVPWRPQSWRVETPGVRIEHVGHHDVLVADAPLTRVRIRMRPFAQPLIGDYTPALAFSDGGLALYTDHFAVSPVADVATVRALPADLTGTALAQPEESLTILDPGRRLLLRGETLRGRASLRIGEGGTYVYSGDAAVIDTPSFAGVIDAGLPAWVRTELDDFTPRLFRLYTERLGPPAGGKPMALVAWQGAERPGSSFGGSVLEGMVVMQLSGQRALTSSPELLAGLRWFLGHESAHFWVGQTIHVSRKADGWIMEGSPDLLAVRALQGFYPDYDARAQLQRELDECLTLTGPGEALAAADERDEYRAYYACGAMLALAAEGVAKQRGGDFFTFLRGLIAARRANGEVTGADWIARFRGEGGDAATAAQIGAFVDKGVDDPRAFFARLFATCGVGARVEGDTLLLV